MAVTNLFDINTSVNSPNQDVSRTLLVISNSSESNKSAFTNIHDSLNGHEIIYILITTILVPVIIVTNILVAVAVGKFKRLQTPTNFYIVSLAAADIFIAIVLPFFTAVEIVLEDIIDTLTCIAPNRMLMMASGVSILTLSLIAYDRHMALAEPLRYVDLMSKKKIVMLICLSWFYSATIVWAPIIAGWYDDIDIPEAYCTFEIMHQNEHLLFVSALFAPSCIVIFVCYIRIYMIARHHARAIASLESSVQFNLQTQFIAKDSKYAKTLAVVIGSFLLLWLPFQICLLYEVVTYHVIESWIRNYLAFLAFGNSALNPWIYAYKSHDIRLAFKRISRSLSSAMRHGHLKDDERRISVVSNVYSSLGTDIHLSKTDSRYAVFDGPSCSDIDVEIHCGNEYLNPGMTKDEISDVGFSSGCTCANQELPSTITGMFGDNKHVNTCPYHRQSHAPSLSSRNRESNAGNRVVSFLEFLSIDDDTPLNFDLPEIGGRNSSSQDNPYDQLKNGTNSNRTFPNHPHAISESTEANERTNVLTKLSVTSEKSCDSGSSVKRVLSFVDMVTLDSDGGKYNMNKDSRSWSEISSTFPDTQQQESSPTKRSSCIIQQANKSQISQSNSYPGGQHSFSSMPSRKSSIVPKSDCNVLSFLEFHSFDEGSSVEENFNLPKLGEKRKGSVVSLSVDLHPNQELILDTKTLTAQFLSDNNGHGELNLCFGPQNRKLSISNAAKKNRSCSVYSSLYSGQHKHLPRLSRQYSLDHTIC